MISINLHQPGRLNVYIQFPEKWEELFSYEVLEISKFMLHPATAKEAILISLIESRARLQKIVLPTGWQQLLNLEQAHDQGLPLLDFLYLQNDLAVVPEPIIKLSFFSKKLYGPLNGFETLTCGEFEDCEQQYGEFIANPQAEPLANIAAMLWRPKGIAYMSLRSGNWYSYQPGKRIKQMLKLAPNRLFAIYLWYTGCRNTLPALFPTVHESDGKKKHDDDQPDLMAFTKCIHAGAGEKNGSREAIRRMKMLEFMFEMEQEAIRAKELKALYEQR